jgi:two-component system sensor histidine kinase YesM
MKLLLRLIDEFKKRTFGVRRKFFLGISFIAIPMIILMSVSLYYAVSNTLKNDNLNSLEQINQIFINNIDLCINDMKNAAFDLTSSKFADLLSMSEYAGSVDYITAQQDFVSSLETVSKTRGYDSIYLFIPSTGRVISQNLSDALTGVTFEEITALPIYKSISNLEKTNGVLSSVTRVGPYSSNLFGVYVKKSTQIYLLITMNKNYFDKILKDAYGKYFEYMIIVGDKGDVVYSSNSEFLNNYKKSAGNNNYNYEGEININNQVFLVSSQRSSQSNWNVLTFTGLSYIKKATISISITIAMITLLFVLLMLVFTSMLSTRLSKNASKLTLSMKRAEQTNYSEFDIINSNDEFGEMSKSLSAMIQEILQNKIYAKDMQLRVLQQQINPHFLYNTFDVISYFILNEMPDEANLMIEKLSDMFRYNIVIGKNYYSTVSEELINLKNYLYIMQTRMRDNLSIKYNISEEVLKYNIPKFTFQPIAENAFTHGFKNISRHCILRINGYINNSEVVFDFLNNGSSIKPKDLKMLLEKLSTDNMPINEASGIGLVNINSRLKLAFGQKYGVKIENRSSRGVKISIVFPAVIPQQDITP